MDGSHLYLNATAIMRQSARYVLLLYKPSPLHNGLLFVNPDSAGSTAFSRGPPPRPLYLITRTNEAFLPDGIQEIRGTIHCALS
jgi:hypothetical protein